MSAAASAGIHAVLRICPDELHGAFVFGLMNTRDLGFEFGLTILFSAERAAGRS